MNFNKNVKYKPVAPRTMISGGPHNHAETLPMMSKNVSNYAPPSLEAVANVWNAAEGKLSEYVYSRSTPNPEKLATTSKSFSRLFPKMGTAKHIRMNS